MIRFHKSPIFDPPLCASPPMAPTLEATQELAASALPLKLPLPAELLVHVSIGNLAGALWSDARGGLSQGACEGICESLLELHGNHIRSRASLARLPESYRRVISELLSTAASLAVIKCSAPCFSVSKRLFNLFAKRYEWRPLWDGKGPDYLVSEPRKRRIRFFEVKGVASPVLGRPPDFSENKAQSLNACLWHKVRREDVPVDAHILSYCTVSPSKGLTVRWFNHSEVRRPTEDHTHVILITALAQFVDNLRSARQPFLADQVKSWRKDTDEIVDPLYDFHLIHVDLAVKDLWLLREGPVRIGIEKEALYTFLRISAWNNGQEAGADESKLGSRHHPDDLMSELLELSAFEPTGPEGMRLMFRLPTGISSWSENPKASYVAD